MNRVILIPGTNGTRGPRGRGQVRWSRFFGQFQGNAKVYQVRQVRRMIRKYGLWRFT